MYSLLRYGRSHFQFQKVPCQFWESDRPKLRRSLNVDWPVVHVDAVPCYLKLLGYRIWFQMFFRCNAFNSNFLPGKPIFIGPNVDCADIQYTFGETRRQSYLMPLGRRNRLSIRFCTQVVTCGMVHGVGDLLMTHHQHWEAQWVCKKKTAMVSAKNNRKDSPRMSM